MISLLDYIVRLVSRFVLRPINTLWRKISKSLNLKLAVQKLITTVNTFFRDVMAGKPAKLEDYYPWQKWLVSKKLLFLCILALIALPILYVHFLDPLVKGWLYTPTFIVNEPNMTVYSGKANITYEDGSKLYTGQLTGGRFTGSGKLYSREGKLRYEGDFVSDQYSGKGELWDDKGNLTYRGDFSSGQYHGTGALYENGLLVYEGDFVKGLMSGFGRLYDDGVLLYEGEFKSGGYEGKGKLYTGEDLLYQGNFVNGLYEGQGSLYYDDDGTAPMYLKYEGGFAAGKYEGQGTLYLSDGSIYYQGEWKNGEYHGYGVLYAGVDGDILYEGAFVQGKYDGYGTLYNGRRPAYIGEFSMGDFHGTGQYFDHEGHFLAYEGEYVRGRRQGKGTLYMADGEILYDGSFHLGEFEGEGRAYDPLTGKLYYMGGFMQGLPHGTGMQFNSINGLTVYEGGYNMGVYEGEGKSFDVETGRLVYEGGFLQGLYHGTGRFYDVQTGQIIYDGEYSLGNRVSAQGLTDANGTVIYAGPMTETGPDYSSFVGADASLLEEAFLMPGEKSARGDGWQIRSYPRKEFQVSAYITTDEDGDQSVDGVWLWGASGINGAKPGIGNAQVLSLLGNKYDFDYVTPDETITELLKLSGSAGNVSANKILSMIDDDLPVTLLSFTGTVDGAKVQLICNQEGICLLVAAK